MTSLFQNFKRRITFIVYTFVLIVSIILGLLLVEQAENRRHVENQRRLIIEQLGTIRAKLEGALNAEILLAHSIITEIVVDSDISLERFDKIAEHFFKSSKHIRNIGLAKGTVLTYVYPREGNLKAIGLDYTKIPAQWPAVKRTIENRKTVLAGPLNLVQGGVGIIARTPIFIKNPNTGNEEFYGLLSVVINIPSLFKDVGLNQQNSDLKFSIKGKDGLGEKGEVFYGEHDLFDKAPVLLDVTLPGGDWLIASIPQNGWSIKSPQVRLYRLFALLTGVIVLLLLFWEQREYLKRKKAEQDKENVITELRDALSKVKQLSGLLPICASCKKIRDDQGYWKQLEEYISDHAEVQFSHSICKECAEKLYPEYFEEESDDSDNIVKPE